jgi:hypothetical protein
MPLSVDRLAYLLQRAVDTQSTPEEGAIARDIVQRCAATYDDFRFQVHVGDGQQLLGDYTDAVKRQWFTATMKRVDVVGYVGESVDLIECKLHVDGAAVRQLVEYQRLWIIRPSTPRIGYLFVAGRTGDSGIGEYAQQFGVKVILL